MYLILAGALVVGWRLHEVPPWVPVLCFGVATWPARSFNWPVVLGLFLGAFMCQPVSPALTFLCLAFLARHVTCTRL